MPKHSEALVLERRKEIVDACEKLYEVKNFKDITIKDIGSVISFARSSIYNYFETKEEIFLALLRREYDLWIEELQSIWKSEEIMNRETFASRLARSLEKRELLLRLMSMNHFDMENNSRPEELEGFKVSYGKSMKMVALCLEKKFPGMEADAIQDFIYIFFPFMFGIYPYTQVSEKQKQAMEKGNVNYVYLSVYEIIYNCTVRLLEYRGIYYETPRNGAGGER